MRMPAGALGMFECSSIALAWRVRQTFSRLKRGRLPHARPPRPAYQYSFFFARLRTGLGARKSSSN